jgi:hypothetical protein
VLSRLSELRQIQGSGQTPASLSHAWTVMEKEFDDAKIQEMREQSKAGYRNVIAYKLLLRKIRGPILGVSDKQVGIIGDFLGEPVWGPCGLKKQDNCFLTLNKVVLRDGKVLAKGKGEGKGKGKGKGKAEGGSDKKWLPVALYPATAEFMQELKATFDLAIQTAASCAVEPMSFQGDGPVVLWMDLSNPPLATNDASQEGEAKSSSIENDGNNVKGYGKGKGKSEKASKDTASEAWWCHSCQKNFEPFVQDDGQTVCAYCKGGFIEKPATTAIQTSKLAGIPDDDKLLTTNPGQEVELDEITTHRNLNLELRYFCSSYLDYNVQAYDNAGSNLWDSTYSRPSIQNAQQKNCVVHCRDIAGNPSPTTPALRTLHLDLDALDENVFALMITSQIFSGSLPTAVSVALRECHNGGACSLDGNHEPHDCKGKLLLAQDISEPLKKGGTTVYACIYRDVNDPTSWLFKNTMDLSLETETRVASQISAVTGSIFRKMFQAAALASTMDANRLGYLRVCQLYQAVGVVKASQRGQKASSNQEDGQHDAGRAHVVLTGIQKRKTEAEALVVQLTGEYVADLETLMTAKKKFTGKAVDANIGLRLAMDAIGAGLKMSPSAVFRIANNSHMPVQELSVARQRAGRVFPFATVDARGHIFDAFKDLPEVDAAVVVPGQVESCVSLLRKLLMLLETSDTSNKTNSAELFLRYVDGFFPDVAPGEKKKASGGVGAAAVAEEVAES